MSQKRFLLLWNWQGRVDFEPTLTECINHQRHMGSDLLQFGAVIFIMRTIYRYESMIVDNHAHRHIQYKPTPPFPLLAYSYFIISHLIWKWPEHSNRPFEVGCFRTQDEG